MAKVATKEGNVNVSAQAKQHVAEKPTDKGTSETTPKAKESAQCVIKPIKNLMDLNVAVWNNMLHKYNFGIYENNLQDFILEEPLEDNTEICEYLRSLVQKVIYYHEYCLLNTPHITGMWSIVWALKFKLTLPSLFA